MMPTLYAPPVLEGPEHLYGVSRPEFQEAPSSWLSRAAMSQDIELDVMCRWLGLSSARDMDVALAESDLAQIACRCNFDAGAFGCVAPMMYTCKALHLKMPLLLQEHGCANYRFCPLCLKEQATPHIPLHWRFSPCRMCLVHQCLLEVRCLRCGAWGHATSAAPDVWCRTARNELPKPMPGVWGLPLEDETIVFARLGAPSAFPVGCCASEEWLRAGRCHCTTTNGVLL